MTGITDIELVVNGKTIQDRVPGDMTLLNFLRERLHLTGTKNGCGTGHCGACTVILNGKAVRSCTVRMGSEALKQAAIETVEGLVTDGILHPLQIAFIEEGAIQCGFCTAGMLMTAKALLDTNPHPDREEIVRTFTANRNLCRCTGYASIIRAVQKAAAMLEEGKSDRVISAEECTRPRLIRESLRHVSGRVIYSDDLFVEGMIYGSIRWSDHPHAEIISLDTRRAEEVQGVVKVVTASDVPGQNRAGLMVPDTPAIADSRVRFIGDPVAAVYAETAEAARRAAALIDISYRVLPAVFSPAEAAAEGAPKVHEGGNLFHDAEIKRGNPEAAFLESAVRIEHTYTTQRIEQGFMEPESGIGIPDDDGGITLKMGTQCAFDDRAQLARILDMPEEKIRIVQMPMGGAFGAKEDILIYQFLALGALLCKRPVKITLSREESLRTHEKRHPAWMKYRVGADSSGRLQSVIADITFDGGAYSSLSIDVLENAVVFACGPYYVPNVDIYGSVWYTNNVPSGAMRGFGAPQVAVAIESVLDELADRLGIDPFEIRKRNALKPGLPTISDHVLEDGLPTVVETIEAAEKACREMVLPPRKKGYRIGVGVACGVKNIGFGHGAEESAGVRLVLSSDGYLSIFASQHEYGQGARAGLAAFASRSLGIDPSMMEISPVDTAETPPTGPTTASRQTFLTGNALLLAAESLKKKIFARAGEVLGIPGGTFRIEADEIVDTAGGQRVALADLGESFEAEERYTAPQSFALLEKGKASDFGSGEFKSRPTHWCYTYGTHVAVVEVHEETGRVRVLKVIAAHDVGTILNRGALIGQTEGGVMMGVGYALYENLRVEKGINLTDTLGKVGLPYADAAPVVETILLEIPHPEGPLGLKGFAEGPSIPTAPAILNAVYNATGCRIRKLPLDPEELKNRSSGSAEQ